MAEMDFHLAYHKFGFKPFSFDAFFFSFFLDRNFDSVQMAKGFRMPMPIPIPMLRGTRALIPHLDNFNFYT